MKYRGLWLIAGILALLGGILALLNPFPASLTAVAVAGWAFLVLGILQVAGVFTEQNWGARTWSLLIGLVAIVMGGWLLANPLESLIPLTIMVGVLFLVLGIVRLMLAFPLRGTPLFWAVLISGALSLLLGVLVFADFPASALSILGILLGVELLSTGVSTIVLSLSARDSRA